MKQKLIALAATFIVKFIGWTCRFKLHFPDDETKLLFSQSVLEKNEQVLLGFFHQDELCLMPYFQHKRFAVLVSLSKDGELMTRIANNLGIETVRGSSSRGAARGLLAAIKKVKEGFNFAIAVDGPRGPIYQVKEGLPAISKKSQVPILPARAYPRRAKIFHKSWNQAKLPFPFTRIDVKFAKAGIYTAQELETKLLKL